MPDSSPDRLPDDARSDIGRAAGRERHNQPDRLGRDFGSVRQADARRADAGENGSHPFVGKFSTSGPPYLARAPNYLIPCRTTVGRDYCVLYFTFRAVLCCTVTRPLPLGENLQREILNLQGDDMRLITSLCGVALMALLSATSQAAPIAFITNGANPIPSYTEGGFVVTFTGAFNPGHTGTSYPLGFMLDGTECFGSGCSSNGSAAAGTYHNQFGQLSTGISIKTVTGNPFTFAGFDGAEGMFANGGIPGNPHWAGRIRVDATLVNNTVLTQFFDLDGSADGPGGIADFESFAGLLGVFIQIDFTGAPSQTYQGNDFFIDNVNVSAVPEPATWALLALASLMLAFGLRRRLEMSPRAARLPA